MGPTCSRYIIVYIYIYVYVRKCNTYIYICTVCIYAYAYKSGIFEPRGQIIPELCARKANALDLGQAGGDDQGRDIFFAFFARYDY